MPHFGATVLPSLSKKRAVKYMPIWPSTLTELQSGRFLASNSTSVMRPSALFVIVSSAVVPFSTGMEKKPLSKINVSELCTRAGVGRVSFYRNFDSMDDILVQHLKKCTDEWWRDFSQKDVESFYTDFWPELLEQYRANGHLVRLLYENNASHLIKDHIFACCRTTFEVDEEESYARAALAGALYGMVDEWIKRGMGSLPENFSIRKITNLIPRQEALTKKEL